MTIKTAELKINNPPPQKKNWKKKTKYMKYDQNRETQRSVDKIKLRTGDKEEIDKYVYLSKVYITAKEQTRPNLARKIINGWIAYATK